ncbi:hypothetical protein C1645_859567 [Glomus cerebriforme]|uniref:F-box domain-containing protein n=1 Tax=Glomus cerebriforme TaxID=658196 RepID=A0A397TCU6_9GLOM|nr:hypothetical protein C1645_859567 [Glomus cerebriforme]
MSDQRSEIISIFRFFWLAQICHNIRYLYVKNCDRDNSELITLIEAQKNLQYFKCNFGIHTKPAHLIPCKGIGEALTKQAHSLISILLSYPIKIHLSKLEYVNLKILKIDGAITTNNCIQEANLPNLEHLEFNHNNIGGATMIIRSTKGNLKVIKIKYRHLNSKEENLMYIQAITQYCPNLNSATLFFCGDNIELKELEKLFLNCLQLERLVLINNCLYTNTFACDRLLELLATYAFLRLSSLKLGYISFSTKGLKTFFEKWKERKPPLISLYIHCKCFKEQVNMINDYLEEGIIKKFVFLKHNDDFFFDWNEY